ncbi:MAG: DUF4276 family protein [Betaproteobacteria bacterium]|nr:DUF4276 family protein [Betaproteobacteria bacterium]
MIQLEVLVEEPSAEEALRHLLPKITRGRGRAKILNLGSKSRLLKVLPSRLAGYRKRIESGEHIRIVVLVDRDSDDCERLKRELERMAGDAGLPTKTSPDPNGHFRVLNRIVVEELESWFIGDPAALRKAFSSLPKIDPAVGIFRNPDNGGTWESLHRFLKKNGIYKSNFPKIDAARRIAPHMELAVNRSGSFRNFISGVEAILT